MFHSHLGICSLCIVVFFNRLFHGVRCLLCSLNTTRLAVKLAVMVPYWLSGRRTRSDNCRYIITLHNIESKCSKRTFSDAHSLPNLLLLLVEHSNILLFSFRYCACSGLNIRTIRSIFPSRKARTLILLDTGVHRVALCGLGDIVDRCSSVWNQKRVAGLMVSRASTWRVSARGDASHTPYQAGFLFLGLPILMGVVNSGSAAFAGKEVVPNYFVTGRLFHIVSEFLARCPERNQITGIFGRGAMSLGEHLPRRARCTGRRSVSFKNHFLLSDPSPCFFVRGLRRQLQELHNGRTSASTTAFYQRNRRSTLLSSLRSCEDDWPLKGCRLRSLVVRRSQRLSRRKGVAHSCGRPP